MTKVVTGGKRAHTYADTQLSSGASDVVFGLSIRLLPYFAIVSSESFEDCRWTGLSMQTGSSKHFLVTYWITKFSRAGSFITNAQRLSVVANSSI